MYSKIIKNGTIVDGTGRKAFVGDIAIEQDKIVVVGKVGNANAEEIIDATGKYIAPGFIDIQNHSDVYWTIFDNPRLDSLLMQGITSALIGNCGASLAPLLSNDALLSIQKWHNLQGVNLNWLTFAEYLKELSKRSFGINLGSLVGYSTLRRGILKDEVRQLKIEEFKIIAKTLEQSLKAGAFGLSSGLSYAHEAAASENELLEIAKILKKHNALFSIHLRSEGAELVDSVMEAVDLANLSGVNMKISHFKSRNKDNWHLLGQALNIIEANYQKNTNVNFDVYPYDYVWQVLYTYLPRWSYEGGRNILMEHLKNPIQRKKIKDYLATKDVNYSEMIIASTTMSMNVVGKTLGEIARRQEVDVKEAMLNLIANGGSEILVFDKNLDNAQVEQLLGNVLSMVATDGAGFPLRIKDRLVHPRSYGTMPKFLNLVLQKGICSLEAGIQKITSTPAKKIGLKNRGVIAVDNYADLVIFDPEIKAPADSADPYKPNHGIDYVFVNGVTAVERGQLLSSAKMSGQILRKD